MWRNFRFRNYAILLPTTLTKPKFFQGSCESAYCLETSFFAGNIVKIDVGAGFDAEISTFIFPLVTVKQISCIYDFIRIFWFRDKKKKFSENRLLDMKTIFGLRRKCFS